MTSLAQLRTLLLALLLTTMGVLTGCLDKPTEHRVRANAYLRGGEAKTALEECDRGLKHAPKDVPLHIIRAKALFELERADEARSAYLKAIEFGQALSPAQLSEAQLGLAIIAMRKPDLPEARTRFEKLIDGNPQDANARINLARVCLQLKDLPCAIKQAEDAAHRRGKAEDVLFTLGRIYLSAKKFDHAKKTFEHICTVVPKAASCPYGLALVAAQQGDKALALKKLGLAIERKLPKPDQLGKDPLLAPIYDEPQFRQLLQQAQQ